MYNKPEQQRNFDCFLVSWERKAKFATPLGGLSRAFVVFIWKTKCPWWPLPVFSFELYLLCIFVDGVIHFFTQRLRHLLLSTACYFYCFLARELPVFSSKAHVFQIDPATKKSWIPCSKQAVTVSFYYDKTKETHRIISVDGTKVNNRLI